MLGLSMSDYDIFPNLDKYVQYKLSDRFQYNRTV